MEEQDYGAVLEFLKFRILQETIKYCKSKARDRRNKEIEIRQELQSLEFNLYKLNKAEVTFYDKLEQDLEAVENFKIYLTVAKTTRRWTTLGVSQNKYFLRIEKCNYVKKTMENGIQISDQEEIRNELYRYYQEHFRCRQDKVATDD